MKRTLRFEKQHRSKVNIHFLFIALMLMVCGWQDVAAKFVEPDGWLVNNSADNNQALTVSSVYDPQVEFLELGVKVNGRQSWKVYGPDGNGVHGGLQGIGGLEAVINPDGQMEGVLNDYFGNSAASAVTAGNVKWNDTGIGGYGALPGKWARPLTAGNVLTDATVWKGKRPDPTGFYYLGARYYEPTSGRFLSADPMGHVGSKALYAYADGDPVNGCDPDGRLGKQVSAAMSQSALQQNSAFNDAMGYSLSGMVNNYVQQQQQQFYQQYGYAGKISYAGEGVTASQVASNVLNVIPVLGAIKQFAEGASGQEWFTGHRLNSAEQNMSLAMSVVGVMPMGIAGGVTGKAAVTNIARSEAQATRWLGGTVSQTESLLGKNFGRLGTVVENPNIGVKMLDEGGHYLTNKIDRMVPSSDVINTLKNPTVVLQQANGRYLYLSQDAGVAISKDGKLITTYGTKNFDINILNVLKAVGK